MEEKDVVLAKLVARNMWSRGMELGQTPDVVEAFVLSLFAGAPLNVLAAVNAVNAEAKSIPVQPSAPPEPEFEYPKGAAR
jgi:hypothetical protein